MRLARPVLDQVAEYAKERGCTVFDKPNSRFVDPGRTRAIRIREVQPGLIYLFDTLAGIIRMERQRRRSDRIGQLREEQRDSAAEGAPTPGPFGRRAWEGVQGGNL